MRARFHAVTPKAGRGFWSLWVSKRIFLRRTDRQFQADPSLAGWRPDKAQLLL